MPGNSPALGASWGHRGCPFLKSIRLEERISSNTDSWFFRVKMNTYLPEWNVSAVDRLPRMDMSFHGGKGWSPISELMRAIILRAIEDYNSGGELREEAIAYFFGENEDHNVEEDDEYIFSFRAICKHMELNPEKTRYAIMNATHRISTRRRAA